MERILKHSQDPKGFWFMDQLISSLLFADEVVLRFSSYKDLQHALGRFAEDSDAAVMRICSSKSEAMALNRKRLLAPFRNRAPASSGVSTIDHLVHSPLTREQDPKIFNRCGYCYNAIIIFKCFSLPEFLFPCIKDIL